MTATIDNNSTKQDKPEITDVLKAHGLTCTGIAKTLNISDHHSVKRALDPNKSKTAGWLLVERVRNRTKNLLIAAGYDGDINELFPSSDDFTDAA